MFKLHKYNIENRLKRNEFAQLLETIPTRNKKTDFYLNDYFKTKKLIKLKKKFIDENQN